MIRAILASLVALFWLVLTAQQLAAKETAPTAEGPYQASWGSLVAHQIPEWLIDAKFGIYAHWGLYSVPAYGEWYAKHMYDKGSDVYKYHVANYGDPAEFGYRQFAPMFKCENYDPAQWAELIKASGAKYAGLAVVHHDGFLLWDSRVNDFNARRLGPRRDLYGELVDQLRSQGLKTIATFHHIRTFDWYLPETNEAQLEAREAGWDLFDPQFADIYWNHHTSQFDDFIRQWKAKVKEVVDNYQPDILWFDGGKFQTPESQHHVLEILSYYLNRADEWDKPVEVLNKLPISKVFNFPEEFGVLTFEEGRDRDALVSKPWIDDMKISTTSWGYVHGQTYKSADEIIDGLVDRTSRGGGLLLSLCPRADGTVNEPQHDVLRRMGRWLAANGEAIYATRPWKIHAEGDEAKLRDRAWKFAECDASDIRFTRSKDGSTLYAIALGYPQGGKLTIESLGLATKIAPGGIKSIQLLDGNRPVTWQRTDSALVITLPDGINKDDLAYALRIVPDGKLEL